MYSLKIKVDIKSHKAYEFEDAITQFIGQNSSARHPKLCEIKKDITSNTIYYFEEEWNSKKKLREHLSSDQFKSIVGAMKVLGEIVDIKLISADTTKKFNKITDMEIK